jgi:acylphosphatase
MTIARRFIIKGRVQGVGYRYFALRAAEDCGAVGTVRNLPDGSVEVIAEASGDVIAMLRAELERGPSYGNVSEVLEIELRPTGRYRKFDVVY